jgi:hypothetical protein
MNGPTEGHAMYRTKVAVIFPLILQAIAFLGARPHRRDGARRLQAEVTTMLRKRRKLAAALTVLCGTIGSAGTTFGEPPETVLESRGVTKVKKFYVVATEDEIGRSFKNIVPVYDAIEAALNQFMAIVQVEDKIQYLDNERILAETRLRSLHIQVSSFPDDTLSNNAVIKNAANINAVTTLLNEQQRTLAYLNQVRGSLEIERKNLVSPAQKQVHPELPCANSTPTQVVVH